jgi:DNA-directed RNA polymerase specialized sigma24 family protein
MGVLTVLEQKFEEGRGSPRTEKAWEALRNKHACLTRFDNPDELKQFCRDRNVGYDQQDPVIHALCLKASEEAQSGAEDRIGTDLLFWVFAPGLWRVAQASGKASGLTPDEVETEVVEGFWEEAIKERPSSVGVAGALVNAARHRVWSLARSRSKEIPVGLEVYEEGPEPELPDPEWSDPWQLICYAQLKGVISQLDAELLFWTKLQDEPIYRVAELLGLSYETGRSRVKRARAVLAQWLGQLGDEYPPRDPNLAREIRNLAEKPSDLAHLLGRERAPKTA